MYNLYFEVQINTKYSYLTICRSSKCPSHVMPYDCQHERENMPGRDWQHCTDKQSTNSFTLLVTETKNMKRL